MKMIHCSDLHLDSRMETNLSAEQARERNHEITQTFVRMARYAAENDVSAVLLAGDIFDSQRISAKTVDVVLDAIANASGVDFLYLRGNHDESRQAFRDCRLPSNLKLFSRQWQYWEYEGVTVAGIEMDGENARSLYDSLQLDPQRINIVMLHGQEAPQPGEDQVCLPLLRGRGIDYLALGHLHSYRKEKLDLQGDYCYCGCLEGRGFDECGPKGFVLLEVGERRVQSRFVPFAARRLHEVPVEITGLTAVSQLRQAMEKAAGEIPSCDLVKFVLRGSCSLDTQKDLSYLTKAMEGRFYFVKIKDESRLGVAAEDYQYDASLKGEMIRMVLASSRSQEEKERMIRWGLQALSGEDILL